MKVGKEYKVEVTQLKISKPFLKVVARNICPNTTEFIESLKDHYEKKRGLNYGVELGALYIACVSPKRFERCRVIQVNEVDKTVLVVFIDCGYQCIVWYSQLKIVDSPSIKLLKPLCREFTIAGVQLKQDSNYSESILQLHDMIVGKEVLIVVKGISVTGGLVDIKLGGRSLAEDIIPDHQFLSLVLNPIKIETQVALISQKKKERDRQIHEHGFRPATLVESPDSKGKEPSFYPEAGIDHKVRISAYEDGPYKFFVQFLSQDSEYQKFQCNLQSYKNDLDKARSQNTNSKYIANIDGQLHRVILLAKDSEVPPSHVKVRLMETGTKSLVAAVNLYHIPKKLACVPPFALQYELADLERVNSHYISREELTFYFQHITNSKQLMLRVESSGSRQYCQLFKDHSRVIDDCANWRPHNLRYPPQKPLRGNKFRAQVCYAESPNLFFVHISDVTNESSYRNLRKSLSLFRSPVLRNPHVGSACIVEHFDSNVRGRVIEWTAPSLFKVEFVDFRFVQTYTEPEIKMTDKEFVKLPPFAIECCLKEYEEVEVVPKTEIDKFAVKVREKTEIELRVVRRDNDRYIVEVDDWNDVAKASTHPDDLDLTDWTTANSSIGTHFAKHHNLKRKFADESDGDDLDFEDSILSNVAESSNNTADDPNNLSWQEHVITDKSDWSGVWEKPADPKTPINLGPEVERHIIDWNTETSSEGGMVSSETEVVSSEAELVSSESTERTDTTHSSSPASSSGIGSVLCDSKPARIPIRITSLVSPTEFTIQKLSVNEEFKAFNAELQVLAKAQPPQTDFRVDTFCLAYNVMASKWARAVMIDVSIDDFLITLKCLDTGSTFSIADKKHLLNIPVKYIIFSPKFSYCCSLPIRHDLNKEDKISKYLINEKDADLSCHFITEFGAGLYFIELYQGDMNVTDYLVESGYAKRQVIVPTDYCRISSATNQCQFAIQVEKTADLLSSVQSFADNYQMIEIKNPEHGMIAMVPWKSSFVRARVMNPKGSKIRVYLVDIGEYVVVNKVGAVNNKAIEDIPPIAIKCSLALPSNMLRDKEIGHKFRAFATKGTKRLFVNMVRPGDESACVDLSIDVNGDRRENITSWLLQP